MAGTILLALEVGPPVLVKPLDDFNCSQHMAATTRETPSQKCPDKPFLNSGLLLFKPRRLRIICYAAIITTTGVNKSD